MDTKIYDKENVAKQLLNNMEEKEVYFENLNLSQNVKKALKEIGYTKATPIQEKTIPLILEGKDLIGQSQTGTGKTAAFGLPMMEKIDTTSGKVQSIILCPTRELALQVAQELRKYLKYQEGIKCLAVYGGESIERQILKLKAGVQIVIGTPGRVMDHMRRKTLKLANVKMVVLDEADEMLNMGFEEDIETILKDVPEERQTVLFSATMNPRILKITRKYLKNPVNVKIKTEELTVEKIRQEAIEVKIKFRNDAVSRLIDVLEPKKAIIFCNTKRKVDELIEFLKQKSYKAEALHGDIKQNQRERIMKKLKSGEIQILVATDVAARGIDVKDLELVINYDIPQETEYYVHRVGRTGRNGNDGVAYTLFTGKEKYKLREIEKYANTKIKETVLPTSEEAENKKNEKIVIALEEILENKDFVKTNVIETLKAKKYSSDNIANAILTMLLKKNVSNKDVFSEAIVTNEEGNVRLFVNVGKKDKIMVKDIVGSFSANTGISGSQIGKVNILDNFSFVDVPAEYVADVMQKMNGNQIKGRKVNIEIANN